MPGDDLSRDVYCILGMPIDACDMRSVLRDIEAAAANKSRLFISAPNFNTLVNMQLDSDFRESLFQSDLCPIDGEPIVLIARLLGVPINSRIAGSDIFDALKAERSFAKPLRVFLFGGPEDVAAAACRALNSQSSGLCCVGFFYPGFGSVDEMSRDDIIDKINSSGADFLVVALGAKKGQLWLHRNQERLLIPVRSHLGAVVNFQAGTIDRAPPIMRRLRLEWLWRIKEEPHLWRRYWHDGWVLLRLLVMRVLPLALWTWCLRTRFDRKGENLVITQEYAHKSVTLRLSGPATARHVEMVIPVFRDALAVGKQMIVDFSNTCVIDSRFLGLLLMLRKTTKRGGANPVFLGLSPRLKRLFRFNDLEFLLNKQ
jgi:N-acetylglucosaminyldiphosphoundecaprenol N-acetyl-beta-D-mannosaminyltransferase